MYCCFRYINYKDFEKLLKNGCISIITPTKKQIIPQNDILYKIYLTSKIKKSFYKKTNSRSEKKKDDFI
jgi:hypothetical protein